MLQWEQFQQRVIAASSMLNGSVFPPTVSTMSIGCPRPRPCRSWRTVAGFHSNDVADFAALCALNQLVCLHRRGRHQPGAAAWPASSWKVQQARLSTPLRMAIVMAFSSVPVPSHRTGRGCRPDWTVLSSGGISPSGGGSVFKEIGVSRMSPPCQQEIRMVRGRR